MTGDHAVHGADDVDRWCWQIQALDDLTAFVADHGPAASLPLPTLNWTLGTGRALSAELHTYEPDAHSTLTAYALALGVDVIERPQPDRTVYRVHGRIGRREGTTREPRTSASIRATVWREQHADENQ